MRRHSTSLLLRAPPLPPTGRAAPPPQWPQHHLQCRCALTLLQHLCTVRYTTTTSHTLRAAPSAPPRTPILTLLLTLTALQRRISNARPLHHLQPARRRASSAHSSRPRLRRQPRPRGAQFNTTKLPERLPSVGRLPTCSATRTTLHAARFPHHSRNSLCYRHQARHPRNAAPP